MKIIKLFLSSIDRIAQFYGFSHLIRFVVSILPIFFTFIVFLMSMMLSTTVFADINSDLNAYFNGLGMATNVTAPHAYHGQQAGYYSGGSLFSRNTVRSVQLVQVDLPSFRAGCSGIDLFAGGFSYINEQELIEAMRNILNGAKGYTMLLALDEVSPQLANSLKYIQDIANKVNQMNINSCEATEGIVGGLWPRTRAAQQQVCQDIGTNKGIFADWANARQKCRTSDFNTTMASGANDPQYKNLVLDNGNIAWKALQANNLTASDPQFAELLMSLSGSIIIRTKGNGSSAINLDSLANNKNLLEAILYGKEAEIYRCDEFTQCLDPKKQKIVISADASLKNKVEKLLASMTQKIISDDPLNAEEIGLLQSTRIPIYKVLAVQVAYQKDPNILNIENYSEVIAADILFQYLQENIDLVRRSANVLQYPDVIMKKFNDGIQQAMANLRVEQQNAQTQLSQAMQLIEETQVIEQMLSGQLSTQVGNALTWARTLR